MIRRFGWEDVYGQAGDDEEAKKVLLNIKKRKERAKRKKAHRADEGDEEASMNISVDQELPNDLMSRRLRANQRRPEMPSRTSCMAAKASLRAATTIRHPVKRKGKVWNLARDYVWTKMNQWTCCKVQIRASLVSVPSHIYPTAH